MKFRYWLLLALGLLALSFGLLFFLPWGFARPVSPEEQALRLAYVEMAREYLGARESDGSHETIIDLYNSHEPLAQGYAVTYTDDWCATFVSAVAIRCGYTRVIPTECGCQRQIGLLQALDSWVEDDGYVPLPGDLIYYCREDTGIGDCEGWSNHVGIVVGTLGNFIRVIEGNSADRVQYRTVAVDGPQIRGFGTPDYSALLP